MTRALNTQDALVLSTLEIMGAYTLDLLENDGLIAWAWQMVESGRESPAFWSMTSIPGWVNWSARRDLTKVALAELGLLPSENTEFAGILVAYPPVVGALIGDEIDPAFLGVLSERLGYRYYESGHLWPLYLLYCAVDDIQSGQGFSTHMMEMTSANWKEILRKECENWLHEAEREIAAALLQVKAALS